MGNNVTFDQRVLGWVNQVRKRARAGVNAPDEFISLNHFVHEMRLYKSRAEIAAMKKAARISAQAHKRAMQVSRGRSHPILKRTANITVEVAAMSGTFSKKSEKAEKSVKAPKKTVKKINSELLSHSPEIAFELFCRP